LTCAGQHAYTLIVQIDVVFFIQTGLGAKKMISEKKLQFYIQNNLNVLMRGKHGVGKTSIIKKAFEDAGLNYLYFSASTMDPWVDFVGVPKVCEDEDGTKYLDLLRPKVFEKGEIHALFFDEFNRSPKKVRNAVMELLLSKSINGKPFPNLKIVWAAINPEDDEDEQYDVEKLDPAQEDRFDIQIDIPYKPDRSYFCQKYGKDVGLASIEWWDGLTHKEKNLISPRRLDTAIGLSQLGGDLKDALHTSINTTSLNNRIASGPIKTALNDLYKNQSEDATKDFFANSTNLKVAMEFIEKKSDWLKYFLGYIPEDVIISHLSKVKNLSTTNPFIKAMLAESDRYGQTLTSVSEASGNKKLSKDISKILGIGDASIAKFRFKSYTDCNRYAFPSKLWKPNTCVNIGSNTAFTISDMMELPRKVYEGLEGVSDSSNMPTMGYSYDSTATRRNAVSKLCANCCIDPAHLLNDSKIAKQTIMTYQNNMIQNVNYLIKRSQYESLSRDIKVLESICGIVNYCCNLTEKILKKENKKFDPLYFFNDSLQKYSHLRWFLLRINGYISENKNDYILIRNINKTKLKNRGLRYALSL